MNIAVFCGSGFGNDERYTASAGLIGRWIADNGHTLVYGGGDSGLMGETARNVQSGGAHVIGVLPGNVPFICERPQPYCSEVIIEEDMAARKQKMFSLADAFIALPGGIGTIDEISEAITLTKIGVFRKPSVLFNENGFYEPFRSMIDKMEKTGFIPAGEMDHVLFSDDPCEIGAFLNSYFGE